MMSSGSSSWRSLLLRIGDRCPDYGGSVDFKDHIETCYGILWRDFAHSKSGILELILQCAEQLPHKIPFYGVLVGLINLENEDFVKKVVNNTRSELQDALQSGNYNKMRILLRFLVVLMCSNVLLPGPIIEVFETLLSSAATTVDEEAGNPSWQPQADFYVRCILSSLPWCGLELFEQAPDDLDRIMIGIQSYLGLRKHISDVGCAVFTSSENIFIEEKDHLEDLWDRIQVLSSSGWKTDSVPRPHLSFEAQLVEGKSHDFIPIVCPELPREVPSQTTFSKAKDWHEANLKFPRRLRRLNIFPASNVESMKPIDRFVVEEYLLDVLLFFNGCRKECASLMVGLPVPFRYEYLMAETIFSQILLLPQPPFKPLYYTLVILDLCKALPGAFPAVIAGAVRALFGRIADLDMECRIRLILWFSHHLSNFQFVWQWDEWAHVIDLPKWAPQRLFVQEVLEREVRLSYWEKIKQSVESTPNFEELLPPKGGSDFKYRFEDGHEQTEGHNFSLELSGMVRGRKSAREITSWVEESITSVHGSDFALEVVVQTLLDIGSKSFTHLITVLERYGQVIGRLCSFQEKQVRLIEEVSSYWKNNTQMNVIAIDRMMGYRLVSNLAIVDWVFSSANVDQFHLSDHPWEILRNAISKTNNRIADLRREISSLEKGIISARETVVKAKEELEVVESKLEVVNGEPVPAEKPGRLRRLKVYLGKTEDEETSLNESLEAKQALLARAGEENKMLFVLLFKNFAHVLAQRLPEGFTFEKTDGDAMAVDSKGTESMETDHDGEKDGESQTNGERVPQQYNIGEHEQWGRSTLAYVKSFSRQYATEIWSHMEILDSEVFVEDVNPHFRRAVFVGLGQLDVVEHLMLK